LGFEGESWGSPDLEWLGVKTNSFLFRPGVWGAVCPLFSKVISIGFRDVSDADIARLVTVVGRYSYSFELSIASDKVTDSGMRAVARLTTLTRFSLYSSDGRISEKGVAALRALPNLEALTFDSRGLGDQCALEISRFPRLREIALCEVWVSDGAFDAFAEMKTLTALDLRGARFSVDGSKRLERLKKSRPDMRIMD
jgi:hypothetical protein